MDFAVLESSKLVLRLVLQLPTQTDKSLPNRRPNRSCRARRYGWLEFFRRSAFGLFGFATFKADTNRSVKSLGRRSVAHAGGVLRRQRGRRGKRGRNGKCKSLFFHFVFSCGINAPRGLRRPINRYDTSFFGAEARNAIKKGFWVLFFCLIPSFHSRAGGNLTVLTTKAGIIHFAAFGGDSRLRRWSREIPAFAGMGMGGNGGSLGMGVLFLYGGMGGMGGDFRRTLPFLQRQESLR